MNHKRKLTVSMVLAALALGAGGYYLFGSGGDGRNTTSIEHNIRKAPATELAQSDEHGRHAQPGVEPQASPVRRPPHPVQPRPTNIRRPPRRDRHPNVKRVPTPPAA